MVKKQIASRDNLGEFEELNDEVLFVKFSQEKVGFQPINAA
ncbi:hypothetical protein A5814_001321 [Enterococcus faecium]|nr:hypothetical protein A5814_001321 [Enterococcus faecium]